jgi:hypothetical protein
MSFNKENFFQEGNSEEFFVGRFNPLANPANAEILRIEQCGNCALELVAELYNGMGVVGLDLASPTSGYDFKYIKLSVTDGRGNFVTAVGTGINPDVEVSNTGLLGDEWTVTVVMETGEGDLISCNCKTSYSFSFDASTGALTLDTVTAKAPVLALYEVDGTVTITTLALGSFPNGADIPFQVELHNTGTTVLTVASATPVADVLSASLPQFAGVIYPGGKYTLSAVADGNLGAGAQNGDINFVSNGGNITLVVTWTLTV